MIARPSSKRSTRTPGRVVGDARPVVVGSFPARADPDLDAAIGQEIHGGQLFGEHDRVLVVVVPDERTDAQGRGRLGGGHQRGHGGHLVSEVVGERHRRVPEILDPTGVIGPLLAGEKPRRLDAEAEAVVVCHPGTISPRPLGRPRSAKGGG